MRNCSKTLALVQFDPNVTAANCGPSVIRPCFPSAQSDQLLRGAVESTYAQVNGVLLTVAVRFMGVHACSHC
jgi:hypothetical protein